MRYFPLMILMAGCASSVPATPEPDICALNVLAPRSILAAGARSDTAVTEAIYEYVPRECQPWLHSCENGTLTIRCADHVERWAIQGDGRDGLDTSVLVSEGSDTYELRLILGGG